MSTIIKAPLSGSTNGDPIAVAATATPGTTVHTSRAVTAAGSMDEVWLWLTNQTSNDAVATVELTTTTGSKNIKVTVPANDSVLAIPGVPVRNAGVVGVFGAASTFAAFGYVNQIN